MKIKKIIVAVCILLACINNINAHAEGATPTDSIATDGDAQNGINQYDEKKGIVNVQLIYTSEAEEKCVVKSGYAFLIGDGNNVYAISETDKVTLSNEEKNSIAAQYGVETDKVDATIEILLKDDITVEMSVVNSSENMNFAILQSTSGLGDCTTLGLCDDISTIPAGTVVHTYDNNMQWVDCTIDDWSEIDDSHYYRYTASKDISNGIPLFDDDGEVVGIASGANKSDGQRYALQIDEVIDVLDMLGVAYSPEIVVDTSGLEEIMQEFSSLNENKYTPESWKECRWLYNQAVDIMDMIEQGDINVYTQNEVNNLQIAFRDKIDSLQKAGISKKTIIIIGIIIASVLLVAIIALIIALIVLNIKHKKRLNEEANKTTTAKDALKLSGRITPGTVFNDDNMPMNRSLIETGEVTLPDIDYSETSVLSKEMESNMDKSVKTYPKLVRCKTGETVTINQDSFIIGASDEQSDYCIKYNSNISRRHVCIMRLEDGYYIQDLDTTNGTSVNDMRVVPGRYVKLDNGCIIRMAEEEFEYSET